MRTAPYLIRDVFRLRAVSSEQLYAHHFPGIPDRTARYCIGRLMEKEVLMRHRLMTPKRAVTIYTIHSRHISEMLRQISTGFESVSDYRRSQVSALSPTHLEHRLLVNEVYFTIRRHVREHMSLWLDGKEGGVHASPTGGRAIICPDGRYGLTNRTLWFEVDSGTMRRLAMIEKFKRYREAFEIGFDLPKTPNHNILILTTGTARAIHIADLAALVWPKAQREHNKAVVRVEMGGMRVSLYAAPSTAVLTWLNDRFASVGKQLSKA